jgi:hypothetical protein
MTKIYRVLTVPQLTFFPQRKISGSKIEGNRGSDELCLA